MSKKNFSLVERMLLFIADWQDFNIAIKGTKGGLLYVAGHPKLHKHKIWMKNYIRNKEKTRVLQAIISYLKKNKMISAVEGGKFGYILTEKGQEKVLKLNSREKPKMKLPNSQWLMIFFDIPENMRHTRDIFRKNLKNLGCEQLQKSIWITPYDIIGEIKDFIQEYNIKNYARLLIVKDI